MTAWHKAVNQNKKFTMILIDSTNDTFITFTVFQENMLTQMDIIPDYARVRENDRFVSPVHATL